MALPEGYRRALAVYAVVAFFTSFCDYLTPFVGFPQLYWIVALVVLALPLVLAPDTLSVVLASPLLWWCGLYAAMSLAWFIGSSQSAIANSELRSRLLAVIFLVTLLLVLTDARVHRAARLALLGSVFVGVALNVVDLLRPVTFNPTPGRAAGLYINPNISAIALVLGMIMSIELIPRALRPWYACFVGAGVLMTFSRGGMAAWLLATGLIVGLGAMRLLPFIRIGAATALIGFLALSLSGRLESVIQVASVVSSDAWGRLRVGEGVTDVSATARIEDARAAWSMFLDSPLVGHGVGATTEWDSFESTHNIYLRHLAEYGIAGLTIVPALVLALLWRRSAARSPVTVWLAGVVLLWSIFSHNILDERHFLICVALTASLAKTHAGPNQFPTSLRESGDGISPSVAPARA